VAMDEAVTLENLGVALRGEGPAHPERRRLLEGYLALKREMTVELLATCCEQASETELERLEDACFALRDAARWEEDSRRWAELEFELLRLAAHVAARPGHLLLIHSLERSFWGMAGRLLPSLNREAFLHWSVCALAALSERDAQALKRELPALLQAGDEHLLGNVAPARKADVTPESSHLSKEPLHRRTSKSEPARDELSNTVCPDPSPGPTHSWQAPSAEGPPGDLTRGELPDATFPNLSGCHTGSSQVRPTGSAPPEPASTALGDSSNPTTLETGGPPGSEEARSAHMGSPERWTLAPPPDGSGAAPHDPAMRDSPLAWLGLRFEDT